MTLEVIVQVFEDLSEEEKLNVPDNGAGKECASYLRILHNGKTIGLYSDAMEPEDAIFYRDLKWIKCVIIRAYQAGLKLTGNG